MSGFGDIVREVNEQVQRADKEQLYRVLGKYFLEKIRKQDSGYASRLEAQMSTMGDEERLRELSRILEDKVGITVE